MPPNDLTDCVDVIDCHYYRVVETDATEPGPDGAPVVTIPAGEVVRLTSGCRRDGHDGYYVLPARAPATPWAAATRGRWLATFSGSPAGGGYRLMTPAEAGALGFPAWVTGGVASRVDVPADVKAGWPDPLMVPGAAPAEAAVSAADPPHDLEGWRDNRDAGVYRVLLEPVPAPASGGCPWGRGEVVQFTHYRTDRGWLVVPAGVNPTDDVVRRAARVVCNDRGQLCRLLTAAEAALLGVPAGWVGDGRVADAVRARWPLPLVAGVPLPPLVSVPAGPALDPPAPADPPPPPVGLFATPDGAVYLLLGKYACYTGARGFQLREPVGPNAHPRDGWLAVPKYESSVPSARFTPAPENLVGEAHSFLCRVFDTAKHLAAVRGKMDALQEALEELD